MSGLPTTADAAEMLPGAERPWGEQSNPERLSNLTRQSLDTIKAILDIPSDPQNLKLLSIQKDAALSVLASQIKVDQTRLRARDDSLLMQQLDEKVRRAKADLLAEARVGQDANDDLA